MPSLGNHQTVCTSFLRVAEMVRRQGEDQRGNKTRTPTDEHTADAVDYRDGESAGDCRRKPDNELGVPGDKHPVVKDQVVQWWVVVPGSREENLQWFHPCSPEGPHLVEPEAFRSQPVEPE